MGESGSNYLAQLMLMSTGLVDSTVLALRASVRQWLSMTLLIQKP